MPLQTLNTGDAFVRRTRVNVSNEDREPPGGLFDYRVRLPDDITGVIGCELVGFSFAKRLTPTFRGRYTLGDPLPYADASNTRRAAPNGNTVIDVRMVDETATVALDFAVDLDLVVPAAGLPYTLAGRFLTIADIGSLLGEPIALALDAQGDATLNTTNYTVNTGVDTLGRFYCYAHRAGDPATQAAVTFRFRSGYNSTDSAHRVLGFAQEDTTPDPDTSGVQGAFAVDPTPIRYVDIRVKELAELRPLARVFLAEGDFRRPVDKPAEFRLLTEPVRRLGALSLELTFNDRQECAYGSAPAFHDILLEVISLDPLQTLPTWVDQRFLVDR
jgi:hypothetical protein